MKGFLKVFSFALALVAGANAGAPTYGSVKIVSAGPSPSLQYLGSGSGYYTVGALGYAAPSLAYVTAKSKPAVYSQSVPAAAVRNVETVMVTKTITPVVTKTTTHHTQAEPALSIGHVQGYSQGAVGVAKIAPVSYDTQYTTYANPTVGINGPVLYTGIAAAPGIAVKGAAVAAVPAAVAVGPEPVAYKTGGYYTPSAPVAYKAAAVLAQPAVYKTAAVAAAPAYYPSSLATLGIDASYASYLAKK